MTEFKEHLMWVDVETTGLDPHKCDILEIGVILTDHKMVELDRYHAIVSHYDPLTWEPEALKMHMESGLAKVCIDATGSHLSTIRQKLWALLNRYENRHPDGKPPVLAGSSVHFDRKWLEVYLPSWVGWLNYRNFDVSSLWRACVMAGHTIEVGPKQHDVMADLQRSMNVAKQCLDLLDKLHTKEGE